MQHHDVVRRVEAHLEAVGAVKIEQLCDLYAVDAQLYDSVDSAPVIGRDAIRRHFTRWLTEVRVISAVRITVTGHDNSLAAVTFTATAASRDPVGIIDVFRFGNDLLITQMSAFAVK